MPVARLHIYKGPRAAAELRRTPRIGWHAAKDTRAGEIAFFYEAAPVSSIVAVGRAVGESWKDRTWGLLITYRRWMLGTPLSLATLRADDVVGRWPVWRMLSRTHVRIPPLTAAALARLASEESPAVAALLAAINQPV